MVLEKLIVVIDADISGLQNGLKSATDGSAKAGAAMGGIAAPLNRVEKSAEGSVHGLGRLERGLVGLVTSASGADPHLAHLAGTVGTMAIEGPVIIEVLLGLGAIAIAYETMTGAARKATAQQDALIKSLNDQDAAQKLNVAGLDTLKDRLAATLGTRKTLEGFASMFAMIPLISIPIKTYLMTTAAGVEELEHAIEVYANNILVAKKKILDADNDQHALDKSKLDNTRALMAAQTRISGTGGESLFEVDPSVLERINIEHERSDAILKNHTAMVERLAATMGGATPEAAAYEANEESLRNTVANVTAELQLQNLAMKDGLAIRKMVTASLFEQERASIAESLLTPHLFGDKKRQIEATYKTALVSSSEKLAAVTNPALQPDAQREKDAADAHAQATRDAGLQALSPKGEVFGALQGALQQFTPAMLSVTAIMDVFAGIMEPLQPILDIVSALLKDMGNVIGSLVLPIVKVVAKVFSYVVEAVGYFVEALGKFIDALVPDWISKVGKGLADLGGSLVKNAKDQRTALDKVNGGVGVFDEKIKKVNDSLTNVPAGLKVMQYRFDASNAASNSASRPAAKRATSTAFTGPINVYGVQNVKDFLKELQAEVRRSAAAGNQTLAFEGEG